MRGSKLAGAMCLALGLVACSNDPTNEELKQAISVANKQGVGIVKSILGVSIDTEVHSVTKIACKSMENSTAVRCDYQLEATVPVLGRQTTTTSGHFIKTNDGWRVLSN